MGFEEGGPHLLNLLPVCVEWYVCMYIYINCVSLSLSPSPSLSLPVCVEWYVYIYKLIVCVCVCVSLSLCGVVVCIYSLKCINDLLRASVRVCACVYIYVDR